MAKQNKVIPAAWSLGALILMVIAVSVSLFIASVAAVTDVSVEFCGSRIVAKAEGTVSSYTWQRSDSATGTFVDINGENEFYYDITSEDEGKYIRAVVDDVATEAYGPIGKLITMDIGKGAISLGTTYSGKDSDGNSVSGTHTATNIYVILHKENGTKTENNIVFSGNLPNAPFDVTLAGVNMGGTPTNHNQAPGNSGSNTPSTGEIRIPATSSAVKKVTLRLRDENIVRYISYYNGSDTNTPAKVTSSLKITDINGDGEVEGGCLYVPVKLAPEEIEAFVNSKTNYNHWNAGIGGTDGNSLVQNLHIAGGKIQVVTTLGDNCTAIGAGGNGYCQMEISGGEVIAHCNGTGAAIGGGIGWNAAAGKADILITGGKIYAENHARITAAKDGINHTVGGVAIGSGSTFHSSGSDGTVTITGGEVEAYGAYGNGIGGGNSSSYAGGGATINITGGTVKANSIGGGNSAKGAGGSATITIDNDANVRLTKEGTDCDFCGIGGGNSLSGNGGKATITVKSGTINSDGSIGGGEGGGTGNGGDATVNIYGGNLTAASIGGGTGSVGGHGGAAIVEVTDGFIETGSIGGGKTNNPSGNLGYAKATISGGDIAGQFLMAAGGTEACTFTMTGGTLHGVNTADTSKFNYAQQNGAAVYMDDPNGVVSISGGKITNCASVDGGAIFMSDGTCNISGTALITNCTSTQNGGAICLEGGKVTISGGTISDNNASENGGAVYMGGGTMTVNNGVISKNEASVDGGAVYIGDGTMIVNGGTISENNASENGGAVYMGGGTLTVYGGEIISNSASESGGGAFVDGGTVNVAGGSISKNTAAQNGGGIAVNNGSYYMVSGHVDENRSVNGSGGGIYVSADGRDVNVAVYSGSVSSNVSAVNGGALAVVGEQTGTEEIFVQIGINNQHFNIDGSPKTCDHDHKNLLGDTVDDCPAMNNNRATSAGGAIYVTGNNDTTTLNIYCLTESGSVADGENHQSDFMKVEGGKVSVTTSNNMDVDDETLQNDHYGNTLIHSTIYVTGGEMDLWGEMTNPNIKDIMTVDIEKDGDYFKDHRLNTNTTKLYKLLYFENFLDPVTGTISGQYKEYMIEEGTTVEILGNIYSHPGYTLKNGWNTKDSYKEQLDDYEVGSNAADKTLGWYRVGNGYLFDGNPRGDLKLYAIWHANGYTVKYKANVPLGESYRGTMNDSIFYYDTAQNLSTNQFFRPGYIFDGWCEDAVPKSDSIIYTDGQSVTNLTTEYGGTVTLFAQWRKCDHEGMEKYTYSVVNDGKTLRRDCSCERYYEEVSIFAENAVYDKLPHKAEVTYSSDKWEPEVILKYEALEGDTLVDDNLPYYAGKYRANISCTVDSITYTASVDYEIEKDEQAAPNKPEYETTTSNGISTISILPVDPSGLTESDPSGYDSLIEYKLVYNVDGIEHIEIKTTEQEPTELFSGKYAVQFTVDVVLTNYYIYVSYGEGSNYKASKETAANSVYFYSGENVEIIINNPEGIIHELVLANEGSNIINSGAEIRLTLLDGYYFPQGYDDNGNIKVSITRTNTETDTGATFNVVTPCERYSLSSIKSNTRIVIEFPDAYKKASISSFITEGQVFGRIVTSSAVISRDSAYSVFFNVDSYYTDEYENLSIIFGQALPLGTTVIMQDKDQKDYFTYFVDADNVTSISLEAFIRMGDSEGSKFVPRNGNMKLQFVVDFSQVNGTLPSEDIITSLECNVNESTGKVSASSTATLKDIGEFTLTAQNSIVSLTHIPSLGVASKYDGRECALVFTLTTGTLPPDAALSLAHGEATTVLLPNGNNSFIYPVSYYSSSTIAVNLISELFGDTETDFKFHVDWMVSNTKAERAPMNGSTMVSVDDLTVSCKKDAEISIKIVGDNKLYTLNEIVTADVEWRNIPTHHTIEIDLMRKSADGEYANTGVSVMINKESISGRTRVQVPLAGNSTGSYCLHITDMSGVDKYAEAYYYFIVQ